MTIGDDRYEDPTWVLHVEAEAGKPVGENLQQPFCKKEIFLWGFGEFSGYLPYWKFKFLESRQCLCFFSFFGRKRVVNNRPMRCFFQKLERLKEHHVESHQHSTLFRLDQSGKSWWFVFEEGRKECHTHGTHFLKCHSSFLMMNLSLFWWVGGHSSFEMVQVSIFKASRWIQRGFTCIFLFYVSSPSHPKRSADSPGARTPAVTRLGCKFLGSIGLHQGFELWNLPQKNEHEKRDKKKIIPS